MGGPFAIVADDLTGAADAAGPFAAAGAATRLVLDVAGEVTGHDVIAVSTETRDAPAATEAAVGRLVRALRARGVHRFYGKIDSTLRGDVAAHVGALMSTFDAAPLVVVCPSLPAQGRTMQAGRVVVDGDAPTTGAMGHLAEVLAPVGTCASVDLDTVRRGPTVLACALVATGAAVVVVDAVDERDLEHVAGAIGHIDRPVLAVGSAGLAGALAGPSRGEVPVPTCHHVLVVVGSLHPSSRRQVAALAGRADVEVVEVDPSAAGLADGHHAPTPRGGRTVVITTPDVVGRADPAEVANLLGRLATARVEGTDSGLVLTGGAVAHAVLRSAQATAIDLVGVLAPGVPVGRIVGGTLAGMPVVTKSGGFGGPSLLGVVADALRNDRGT